MKIIRIYHLPSHLYYQITIYLTKTLHPEISLVAHCTALYGTITMSKLEHERMADAASLVG